MVLGGEITAELEADNAMHCRPNETCAANRISVGKITGLHRAFDRPDGDFQRRPERDADCRPAG